MSSESAERYRNIAAAFTERVRAVPAEAWENPAPCEGWVARDVVRHLVEWLPHFFVERFDLDEPVVPDVDTDPLGAWLAIDALFQAALDDPEIASRARDTPMGPGRTFVDVFDMIGTNDVFMHTWDLARATGLDDRLDPDEVHRLFVSMEPLDEMLRGSGHYGPRVPVPDDADEQTKLMAFIGRQP